MKNYTILALALTVNVLFGQDLKTNDNQSQSSTNSIELNTIFDNNIVECKDAKEYIQYIISK